MDLAQMNIVIGANVQDALKGLENISAELKDLATGGVVSIDKLNAALTTLRDRAAKATDIGELAKYNRAIEALGNESTRIRNIGTSFDQVGKSSNSAAFALTNLGRVAQDAPFGFIAIQNNLNPLLESFQRLKAESGSTGAALKALGSGLIGPAGLGIALSIASSLLVYFTQRSQGTKKPIEEQVNITDELTKATKSLNDQLKNTPTLIDQSNKSINDLSSTLEKEQDALKNINGFWATYLFGIDGVRTAQAAIKDKIDETTKSLQDQKKAQDDLLFAQGLEKQIASGKLEIEANQLRDQHNVELQLETQKKIADNVDKATSARIAALRNAFNLELQLNKLAYDKQSALAFDSIGKQKVADENFRFENLKAEQDYQNDLLRIKKEAADKLNTFHPVDTNIKDIPKRFISAIAVETGDALAAVQRTLDKNPLHFNFPAFEIPEKFKQISEVTDLVKSSFDDLFSSIASGASVFETIGNELKKLITRIAAAVVEAAILRVILTAFFPAQAGLSQFAFGSLFSSLSGLPKFASGGVVTRPTLALVGDSGPERITPINQISNSGNSFGGQVEFIMSGQVLRGILKRADVTASSIG